MQSLLLIAATFTGSPHLAVCDSSEGAATILESHVQSGTLLFSQGDCLAVRIFTRSPYTHVAAVVEKDGEFFVYDSMNGVGVRKLTLLEYCRTECPETLHVYHPKRKFTGGKLRAFTRHLDSEIGREYGVKHHLTGERAAGIHCAEYVTDALCACQVVSAKRPPKVSPDSLRSGVEKSEIYYSALKIELNKPLPTASPESSCCQRFWFNTKQQTNRICAKLKGWWLCK
ncbi:C40 family peptidase [Thalassoroseus pseudoceratinae]|uniref:hypothetical protein n=1 Tax=Thalassoroseus pseudoceratinae TaxID=2713176 RepID=UPI00142193D5|nr:hypothetical protein [Thalassoroseus pseudoceratinae]